MRSSRSQPRTPMFGRPLDEVLANQPKLSTSLETDIPLLAEKCFRFIETNGLDTVGIFRTSARMDEISNLKKQFDSHGDATFDSNVDVITVAALLKQFLRELPDPLLPFSVYKTCIDAQDMERVPQRVTELASIVRRLPPANRKLLAALVVFLRKVAEHKETNRMSLENIAVCIGPNILRTPVATADPVKDLLDANKVNAVVLSLLCYHDEIFEVAPAPVFRTPQIEISAGNLSMASNVSTVPSPAPSPATENTIERLVTDSVVKNLFGAESNNQGRRTNQENMDPRIAVRSVGKMHAWTVSDLPLLQLECQRLRRDIADLQGDRATLERANGLLLQYETVIKSLRGDMKSAAAPVTSQPAATMEAVIDVYLTDPLTVAEQNLQEARIAENRPFDLAMCTRVEQLEAEKSLIKKELRQFDTAYEARYGIAPQKQEKEIMRPLYQRYKDIKLHMQRLGYTGKDDVEDIGRPSVATAIASHSADNGKLATDLKDNYVSMKAEKRALQIKLHRYQAAFTAKNGRRVQRVEDRAPVQADYARYKTLKEQLQRFEEQHGLPSELD